MYSSFNPATVRLESPGGKSLKPMGFNPATVRLEFLQEGGDRGVPERFQPRNGSIGIVERAQELALDDVSTPQRFDWNSPLTSGGAA